MILFASGLLPASPGFGQTADRYVYMITIPKTSNHNASIQTGFRLNGAKGIVTALHGVADGIIFSALNDNGDVINKLRIVKVDIRADLALISSDELDNRPAEGLTAATANGISTGSPCYAWGHPAGIDLYKKSANIGSPAFKLVQQLVPPASAQDFNTRMSPAADLNVINVEGNLVPGDSGAPLLDSSGNVLGVVDGGILGGAAAISWAIPLNSIVWRNSSVENQRLQTLASLSTANLFAFSDDGAPDKQTVVVSFDGDGHYRTLGEAVAHAPSGTKILVEPGVYPKENLEIKSNFTVVGVGEEDAVTLTGSVTVLDDGILALQHLRVQGVIPVSVNGGRASVDNCKLIGDAPVDVSGGSISISHSELRSTGAPDVGYSFGMSVGWGGTASITDTLITGSKNEGLIASRGSTVVARRCRITSNKLALAIGDSNTLVTLQDCDLRGNTRVLTFEGGATEGQLIEERVLR